MGTPPRLMNTWGSKRLCQKSSDTNTTIQQGRRHHKKRPGSAKGNHFLCKENRRKGFPKGFRLKLPHLSCSAQFFCYSFARATQSQAGTIQVALDYLNVYFLTIEITFRRSFQYPVLNSQQVQLVLCGGGEANWSTLCFQHPRTAVSPREMGSMSESGKAEQSNWEEESLHCSTAQTSGEHLPREAISALCLLWAKLCRRGVTDLVGSEQVCHGHSSVGLRVPVLHLEGC